MMEDIITKYFDLLLEIKELETKKEHLKIKFKTELLKSGDESFQSKAGHLITFREMTATRFNKEQAQKILTEEQLKGCYKETTSKSLRVYNVEQRKR